MSSQPPKPTFSRQDPHSVSCFDEADGGLPESDAPVDLLSAMAFARMSGALQEAPGQEIPESIDLGPEEDWFEVSAGGEPVLVSGANWLIAFGLALSLMGRRYPTQLVSEQVSPDLIRVLDRGSDSVYEVHRVESAEEETIIIIEDDVY